MLKACYNLNATMKCIRNSKFITHKEIKRKKCAQQIVKLFLSYVWYFVTILILQIKNGNEMTVYKIIKCYEND